MIVVIGIAALADGTAEPSRNFEFKEGSSIYGMASPGIVPRVFARVHSGRQTPLLAIIFTAALGLILILTGDLESSSASVS